MRRILIGLGTSLGRFLASRSPFAECYTYNQALESISYCDEAVLVAPANKRLSGTGLGGEGRALIEAIANAADRIVLLSSFDVYPCKGLPLDESATATISATKALLPAFELHVSECGIQSSIVRLPDVFGPNMTRGLGGRLLDRDASRINRVAIHQWYPVRRLESDLCVVRNLRLPIVNLSPEPLPMTAVLAELFPGQVGHVLTPAPYSRIKTRHAEEFGGEGGYIMSAEEILLEMSQHVEAVRHLVSPAGTAGISTHRFQPLTGAIS